MSVFYQFSKGLFTLFLDLLKKIEISSQLFFDRTQKKKKMKEIKFCSKTNLNKE